MPDRLDDFELLLDRHGPAPEAWPPAGRELARDLLARDPRARALLAEAERLDALLRGAVLPPAGPLPAPLAARLASIPAAEPRGRRLGAWWPPPSPRLAWGAGAAALAASAVVGLLLATGGAPPADPDDDYVALASVAFGPQLEPEDDL
jgi:hypothetical protein